AIPRTASSLWPTRREGAAPLPVGVSPGFGVRRCFQCSYGNWDIFGARANVGPGVDVIATQGAKLPPLSGGRDDGRDRPPRPGRRGDCDGSEEAESAESPWVARRGGCARDRRGGGWA